MRKKYIIKSINFNPNFIEDKKILDFLNSKRNVSDYIRNLILQDLEGKDLKTEDKNINNINNEIDIIDFD